MNQTTTEIQKRINQIQEAITPYQQRADKLDLMLASVKAKISDYKNQIRLLQEEQRTVWTMEANERQRKKVHKTASKDKMENIIKKLTPEQKKALLEMLK